jgi:hypothetical protein
LVKRARVASLGYLRSVGARRSAKPDPHIGFGRYGDQT